MSPRRAPQPIPPIEARKLPGLSVALMFPRQLDTCQGCGKTAPPSDHVELHLWRECDPWDRDTDVVLVLCIACEKRLIDAHPRLYKRIDHMAPFPGAMELCVGCRFLSSLACTSPLLTRNGGPGMLVTFPKPTVAHLSYGGGRGEFKNFYKGPPSKCAGREVAA